MIATQTESEKLWLNYFRPALTFEDKRNFGLSYNDAAFDDDHAWFARHAYRQHRLRELRSGETLRNSRPLLGERVVVLVQRFRDSPRNWTAYRTISLPNDLPTCDGGPDKVCELWVQVLWEIYADPQEAVRHIKKIEFLNNLIASRKAKKSSAA